MALSSPPPPSSSSSSSWFPSGEYYFPSDDELLVYLLNFMVGEPFPKKIPVVDLYGEKEPWEIFVENYSDSGRGKKNEVYLLTKLKKLSQKEDGIRIKRKVGGSGKWHGQDSVVKILYEKGMRRSLLGYKKSLVYQSLGKKNPHHGNWLLKEYSLADSVLSRINRENMMIRKRKGYVLCRMRLKIKTDEVISGDNARPDALSDMIRRFKDKIAENSQFFASVPVPPPMFRPLNLAVDQAYCPVPAQPMIEQPNPEVDQSGPVSAQTTIEPSNTMVHQSDTQPMFEILNALIDQSNPVSNLGMIEHSNDQAQATIEPSKAIHYFTNPLSGLPIFEPSNPRFGQF